MRKLISCIEKISQEENFKNYIILWCIAAFFAFFLIYAYFAEIDVITDGTGKVIPSGQTQMVQNLEGGIIKTILVKEGSMVKQGQVLMIIDDTSVAAQSREGELKVADLKAQVMRHQAIINQKPFSVSAELQQLFPEIVKNQQDLYQSQINAFKSQRQSLLQKQIQRRQELLAKEAKLKYLSESYNLIQQEVKLTTPLEKEGVVSQVELLKSQRELNSLAGEVMETKHNILKLQAALAEVNSNIQELDIQFKKAAVEALATVKTQLKQLQEVAVPLKDKLLRTSVRSPVDGIVKLLKVNTVGGVIQPGMDLIEIVPLKESLLIEAKIKPKDVAFLHPGQKTVVKVTAYDYSIYGGLTGKLEQISADSIEDKKGETYYLIKVRTDKTYLGSKEKPLKIIPGMTVGVDIVIGKRTLLQYFLKPFLKAKQKAFHEL